MMYTAQVFPPPAPAGALPGAANAQSDASIRADNDAKSLIEIAAQEVLAVTYWFDPAPRPDPYSVLVRFSGRRADVEGPLQSGDRFVHDEMIAEVIPGSGPVSVTARVRDINPGAWLVTAQIQGSGRATHGRRAHRNTAPVASSGVSDVAEYPFLPKLWRRWTPTSGSSFETSEPVHTHLAPFVRAPGIIPLSWMTLVTIGMAVAVAMQYVLVARMHLDAASVLGSTLASIGIGILGAKAWYVIKHRQERRFDGWCIQGFIVAASLMALLLYTFQRQQTGMILDATAPGLLFGLAIGRLGCFFAGCCGGPPTASRWGVWSSDQRIGARRVPTQLLESALALALGAVAVAIFINRGGIGGAIFAGALAAYTLGRQGILTLRAEPSLTKLAVPVTAVVSASVLVIAVITAVVVL